MNFKNAAILAGLLAASMAPAAQAQGAGGPAQFQSAGATYRFAPGIRAVHKPAAKSVPEALAAVGASAPSFVAEKGRYLLYREPGAAAATVGQVGGAATLPVVQNVETGGLGVVPGTLVAVLAPAADPQSLAGSLGLELVLSVPAISTAIFRVPAQVDIQASAAALAASPGVVSAQIEVKEHFPVAH